MITLTQRSAYIELYKALILYQFKNGENINNILEIKGGNVNDTEALYFSSVESYFWDNAEGAQLDLLGRIVGFKRQGRSDANYSTILQLKIQLNISGGTIPVLLDAIDVIFNASFIRYVQDFNDDRPIANILTDGEVNLFTEFQAITEDDAYNLAFDIKEDNAFITEDGNYYLSTEAGEILTGFGTNVEWGADAIFTEADDLDETILYEALPAGVGLYFMSYLTLEDGETYLTTEDGSFLII